MLATSQGRLLFLGLLFGFIAAVGVNNMVTITTALPDGLKLGRQFTLTIPMATLGTQTRWASIKQAGVKLMVLSLIHFVMQILGGYYLNKRLIPA